MRFFRNSVSFLAVLCVLPTAFGATSRVGVVTNASRRLPTLNIKTVATTTTNTTSSSNLLADSECIDAYTSCMKGDEACGSDFEECTTNVLFHGKMPQCFSTLYQCSTSGISSLFGTSSVDSLSNVQTKNTANEVTRYTYPTDGSVMGQLIIGSSISNRYDTANCVKKYKSCLFKDSVCGEDFELCTTDTQFKKQSALCDSVLGRCQDAGIKELFGQTASAKPVGSVGSGVVAEWMSDGADLAASNAVNTCYKVIDNCFLSACQGNPYRCVEGANLSVVTTADLIGGTETTALNTNANEDAQSNATIKKFFKSSCLDTIGANKYCYMTFHDGDTPKKTDLTDPDNQEDLFSEAYSTRKTYINSKLQDLVSVFDTKAKNACVETIRSCAMRSCGGGTGVGCYSKVFGAGKGATNTINGNTTYDEIKNGCSAVVNTDPNCKYSAATYNASSGNTYSYSFNDNDAFGILFPQQDSLTTATTADPIGAVASLNATLSTSYNENAIAQMKKQCQNVATNCVKSMCGTDYVNCYRNRTDAYSNLTNSGNDGFDKSMNKVGGVLDYTIVLGLCMNTVKTADACEESLAIARANVDTSNWKDSTGSTFNSLRNAWQDAGAITRVNAGDIQETNADDKKLCECDDGGIDVCATEKDGKTNCNEPHMISLGTKVENTAVNTLFRELVADIEMEAQAKYNAKLTKEQNVCLANNNGGIKGTKDTGSTFMWVKLKTQSVPEDYSVKGLTTDKFVASNDLYGSFCRVKVDMISTDKKVQELLASIDNSTTYFAVGDMFTCGSWLKESDLKKITDSVGAEAREKAGENSKKDKLTRGLATLAGVVGGGTAAGFAMDKIQTSGGTLGKVINPNLNKSNAKTSCLKYVAEARDALAEMENITPNERSLLDNTSEKSYMATAVTKANDALRVARDAGFDVAKIKTFVTIRTVVDNKGASAEQDTVNWSWDVNDLRKWKVLLATMETLNKNVKVKTDKNDGSALKNAFADVKNVLDLENSDEIKKLNIEYLYERARAVKVFAGRCSSLNAYKETIERLPDNYTEETYPLKRIQTRIPGKAAVLATYKWDDSAVTDFESNLEKLENTCGQVAADGKDGSGARVAWTGGAALVGAVGTGFLVNKIVRTNQDSKYDTAEQEAVDEWMSEIGSKIKCYVGDAEIGGFGDITSVTVD